MDEDIFTSIKAGILFILIQSPKLHIINISERYSEITTLSFPVGSPLLSLLTRDQIEFQESYRVQY